MFVLIAVIAIIYLAIGIGLAACLIYVGWWKAGLSLRSGIPWIALAVVAWPIAPLVADMYLKPTAKG